MKTTIKKIHKSPAKCQGYFFMIWSAFIFEYLLQAVCQIADNFVGLVSCCDFVCYLKWIFLKEISLLVFCMICYSGSANDTVLKFMKNRLTASS